MLKKTGYFYLIIVGLLLLLALLTGLAGSTDAGLFFGIGAAVLVMFLIWTSPLLLLVLVLLIGRSDSFKQFWARAERFHSGGG